jgi:cytochrome d ubiquinol oxidase subunit I
VVGLWLNRRRGKPESKALRWFWRLGPWAIALPLAANSFGWIFTEMGRQPWTVFGVLQTPVSVSPTVGAATVATSLIVFTALYGVLAVIELALTIRFARAGAPPAEPAAEDSGDDAGRPLSFAY